MHGLRHSWVVSALLLSSLALAQSDSVNAICSTDQSWCEMAATEFTRSTGIQVQQTRKATGEADRKSTRLNSSHYQPSRMPSSA